MSEGTITFAETLGVFFHLGWEIFQLPIPGTNIPFFALLAAPVLFGFAVDMLFTAFGLASGGSGERQSGRGSGRQYRLTRRRENDEK